MSGMKEFTRAHSTLRNNINNNNHLSQIVLPDMQANHHSNYAFVLDDAINVRSS